MEPMLKLVGRVMALAYDCPQQCQGSYFLLQCLSSYPFIDYLKCLGYHS